MQEPHNSVKKQVILKKIEVAFLLNVLPKKRIIHRATRPGIEGRDKDFCSLSGLQRKMAKFMIGAFRSELISGFGI